MSGLEQWDKTSAAIINETWIPVYSVLELFSLLLSFSTMQLKMSHCINIVGVLWAFIWNRVCMVVDPAGIHLVEGVLIGVFA